MERQLVNSMESIHTTLQSAQAVHNQRMLLHSWPPVRHYELCRSLHQLIELFYHHYWHALLAHTKFSLNHQDQTRLQIWHSPALTASLFRMFRSGLVELQDVMCLKRRQIHRSLYDILLRDCLRNRDPNDILYIACCILLQILKVC